VANSPVHFKVPGSVITRQNDEEGVDIAVWPPI
jgi:hypothetical protein